ncbi:MAG TPA: F0F1 ATP synthase subunit gamma [Stellaceae bacterium]|jgi:F-type H+-transporting ATPase subunit gamma|nr:F0F1 ATP synthase subunit gamma [Stellaceae bacterium]
MATLKELRNRIRSIRSTQKITSAQKMVAASRLRRAQEQAEAARPYAQRMERMLASLAASLKGQVGAAPLLAGTGGDQVHLLLVATSDRGLAGGFNATIIRDTRRLIRELEAQGKTVKLLTIGRKGRDALRRDHGKRIVESRVELGRPRLRFEEARAIAEALLALYADKQFDVCTIVFNHFRSAISQIVTRRQLIPFSPPAANDDPETASRGVYEFEPEEEAILNELLPRNLAVQIYTGLLDSIASEWGARMTAMDNATRNAGDIIKDLNIVYNRSRQAAITKELIEIISGAEAL